MIIENMKFDDTDMNIIEILKENGRVQNNEIATRLNISEGTVRNRIKKLTDNKLLSIQGLINPEQIIDRQIIFLGINISEIRHLEIAAEQISNLDKVTSVYMVTGRYDLIAEIFIEPYKLVNFLSSNLSRINSIATTESFITLKSYKKWI